MKIQNLAMIFVIIIIPIALVLSIYAQYQIQTINTQTLYDNKLTSATYDAMRAYQINASNSTTSELSNSKIRDIEASVSTFKNSIGTTFELNGYTSEELDSYIPALVYTMYDGFYIYSPYKNIAQEDGTIDESGEKTYGLKPYISYSCRYKRENIDVVITYALDNHIAVQGTINGKYVNKDGYLIDGIDYTVGANPNSIADYKITYNGVEIVTEQLKEYLPIEESPNEAYPYAKINGTKYYKIDNKIVYILNGQIKVQCTEKDDAYEKYLKIINNNYMAKEYYYEAMQFTNWFKASGLNSLRYSDAYDEVLVKENTEETKAETVYKQIWEGNENIIFQFKDNTSKTINIENQSSQFNQHRLEVIRHKIETNLAIAISNYNSYSNSGNLFQMPELKEDEWEQITKNIALISFLQGMPIGGKIYNGYTLVTNSESSEVVLEENIYMLANDGSKNIYARVGDKGLEAEGTLTLNSGVYANDSKESTGRLNLDFKRKSITTNNATYYYYPMRDYSGSYNSVIMQNNVTTYDDIYEYIGKRREEYKKAFYTALGREREGKYLETRSNITYSENIKDVVVKDETITLRFIPNGENVQNMPADITISKNAPEEEKNIVLNQVPTKENNIFKGWALNMYGEVAYEDGSTIKLNKTIILYAVWEPVNYTIHYIVNRGNGYEEIRTQNKKYNQNVNIISDIPTRTGYSFLGWAGTENGSVKYNPGDLFKENPDKDQIYLYAIWDPNRITITYKLGENILFKREKKYDTDYLIEGYNGQINNDKYYFAYWAVNSFEFEGNKIYRENEIYKENEELTLYAIIKEKVTFERRTPEGAEWYKRGTLPDMTKEDDNSCAIIVKSNKTEKNTCPLYLKLKCTVGNLDATKPATMTLYVEGLRADVNDHVQWDTLWDYTLKRSNHSTRTFEYDGPINSKKKEYKKYRIRLYSTDNERQVEVEAQIW